jgi:hypothetical protein
LQYFINYNLKKGWYLGWQPIITANWKATSGNVWTVPFGGGIGRIMKFGNQRVNFQGQFYGNEPILVSVLLGVWVFRSRFLFPKSTKAEEKKILEHKLK